MDKSTSSIHIPLRILNYSHDWADKKDSEYQFERRMNKTGKENYQPELSYKDGLINGFREGYKKALEEIQKYNNIL